MTRYTCGIGGLLACRVNSPSDSDAAGCFDLDKDGFLGRTAQCPEGLNCNDNDPTIHPDAIETYDGIDRNCDRLTDAIGPISSNESCPDGAETCGPAICAYQPSCVCPDDGADCYCATALEE